MPRYAAAGAGAVVIYGIEQLLTDAFARCAVADFAWTAAAIGAIFGTARAVRASRGADRMVWLLFLAGSVSWLAGQIVRDATEVGQLPMPSPLVADLGFMTAAPLWTIALVLLLRRHGQRLTLYALVLDIGAVVLTLGAAVTLYLATTLPTVVGRDPQATAVAVLYPLLYVAATAAALSAVWGMPEREPRGAVTSLFLGLGLNALAFVLYLPANIEDTFTAGTPIDALWLVGMGAIGIAGAQWVEEREGGRNTRLPGAAIHLSRMAPPGLVAAASLSLLVYSDARTVPAALGLRSSVAEDLRGIALEGLRTRDVVVASDYRGHPDSNPALHEVIASAIGAPLIAHGEIVGTLTAYVSRPRVFSDETRRLVRLYAAQAAIAIANADLLAETPRLARDDDLTGVLNPRSLLERLEAQIAEACP